MYNNNNNGKSLGTTDIIEEYGAKQTLLASIIIPHNVHENTDEYCGLRIVEGPKC